MSYRATWRATTIGGITVTIVAGCVVVVLVVMHPWANSSPKQAAIATKLATTDARRTSSTGPQTGTKAPLPVAVGTSNRVVKGGMTKKGSDVTKVGHAHTVGEMNSGSSTGVDATTAAKSTPPTVSQIVDPYMAQLASLKSQYIGSMTALYDQARAQYHAGKGSKSSIEREYYPQITSLENSAQDQVNSILFALRAKLLVNGYATTPVDTLRSEYQQEVAQAMAKFHG